MNYVKPALKRARQGDATHGRSSIWQVLLWNMNCTKNRRAVEGHLVLFVVSRLKKKLGQQGIK